jgi:phosphatidate phosphatase LPIN
VLVNGRPIPFNMKIGEAGEAFFVFETDEDVPADLMTSPILEATNPSALKAATSGAQPEQQQTGRFGTQKSDTSLGGHQSNADLKDAAQVEEEERKISGDVSTSYNVL